MPHIESELLSIVKNRFVRVESEDLEEILQWVRQNYEPDDVFANHQLDKWAESEGYIKP